MSAEGNVRYLNAVKHAALWADYDLLTDPEDKKIQAREIAFLVPNPVERELYEQFSALLNAEEVPRIPREYRGWAIQRLDSDLVHVYFCDEDGIFIDYKENVPPLDAASVFSKMMEARSALGAHPIIEREPTRKERKRNRKR